MEAFPDIARFFQKPLCSTVEETRLIKVKPNYFRKIFYLDIICEVVSRYFQIVVFIALDLPLALIASSIGCLKDSSASQPMLLAISARRQVSFVLQVV